MNKEKSAIYLNKEVSQGTVLIVELALGILRKEFTFIYLGCPIFHMRKNKLFYQSLMNKVSSKLQGWKSKIISYGGREVLFKHVLQSILIYYLSVINPPLNIMTVIQKMLT